MDNDLLEIKYELNKRLENIIEKSNTILDLKIQLKETEIENLKLRKEINNLNGELAKQKGK